MMKILKPSWVKHDDHPIFSIDVHPDSSRFATGGQGKESGTIVIWNMGPVVDVNKENDENAPKILCKMDHHIACVNIVRWSNNGLFLASGSDDKLIMIWQYVHGGAYENIENWKCGFTLRGHSGDVLDLSWSSKDQYLASCSVDNTVIIWNALKFPDIIYRINAHAGLVKGVAWDPVGNYLASQSDDKSLKIWKTLDFTLEKCIEEPFKQCTGTTHVLRLGWSPDGQLIISAHAINNGAPTAQVIERGNKWSTKLDFVGHRKAVTAVRFFPQILKPYETDSAAALKTHCLCALGSRDRTVSIWLTNYSRALCVIKDLFDNPIMDLSWSKSPSPGLLACSMDGTVSYLEFNYKEIGEPLTKEETEEFFMKKYNYNVNATIALKNQPLNAQNNGSNLNARRENDSIKLIENLDVLLAQEQRQRSRQEQETKVQSSNENSTNLNNSSSNTPGKNSQLTENHKQIERRMPDGRRRITPICISKPGEYDTPKPFVSLSSSFNKIGFASSIGFEGNSITSKTATEQSTIIVEKRDEKNEIVEISPVKSIVYIKPSMASYQNSNSNERFINNNSNQSITNKNTNDLNKTNFNNTINHVTVTTNNVRSNEKMDVTVSPATNSKAVVLNSNIESSLASQPPYPSARKQLLKETNIPNNIPTAQSNANTNKVTKSSTSSSQAKQTTNNQPLTNSPSIQNSNLNTAKQKQQPVGSTLASTSQPFANPTKQTTPVKAATVEQQSSSHHHHHYTSNKPHYYLNPLKLEENFSTRSIKGLPSTSIEIVNSLNLTEKSCSFNQTNESDYQINLIRYIQDKATKWQVYFYFRVCEVAFSSQLVACVCDDATLHLIKPKYGSQLCCPIQLDSKVAVLKVNSNYCMCLTTMGYFYVWKYYFDSKDNHNKLYELNSSANSATNYQNLTTLINKQSCESILRDTKVYGEYSNANLTENGTPILTMSKNRSYFFSLQTQCWHLIPVIGNLVGDESQLLYNSNSLFSNRENGLNLDDLKGPLSLIQSRSKSSSVVKTIELINKSSNSAINKEDFTLTHLESQMNAAIGLGSSKEYKFWLMTYARYLVENDYEEKLTELCSFLLGPIFSIDWNDTILNHKKRELLQEILAILVQNLKLQRLYNYYKQQFNFINNINTKKASVLDRLTAPSLSSSAASNRSINLRTTTLLPLDINTNKSVKEHNGELKAIIESSEKNQPDLIKTNNNEDQCMDVVDQIDASKQTSDKIMFNSLGNNINDEGKANENYLFKVPNLPTSSNNHNKESENENATTASAPLKSPSNSSQVDADNNLEAKNDALNTNNKLNELTDEPEWLNGQQTTPTEESHPSTINEILMMNE